MKKNFFLTALMAGFTMICLLFACEQNEPAQPTTKEDPNFIQLSPKADLNDLSSLTTADRKLLTIAFYRLELDKLGENEKFKIKSGKEVNISEDIYNFFFRLHSANFNKNRTRKKTNGEATTKAPDSTKCVPYIVHDVLKAFGTEISVDEISNWCYENGYYDPAKGTQGQYIPTILNHYFGDNVKQLHFSEKPKDYIRVSGISYVASIIEGKYKGHVVQIEFIVDGKIYGSNSQPHGDSYNIPYTQIGCVYEITK